MKPWLDVVLHVVALLVLSKPAGLLVYKLLELRGLAAAMIDHPGLEGAGRYIGYAERSLIYLCGAMNAWEVVAALLAIKAVVRFPEIRNDPKHEGNGFAEYYLLGTTVSVTLAMLVVLAVKMILAAVAHGVGGSVSAP